nr:YgjP-like metallopeptidase domain-containing protein [Thermococcus celericrescens]
MSLRSTASSQERLISSWRSPSSQRCAGMLDELLQQAKDLLGCQRQVRVKVRPLKTSIARVSFKYGTITVDPSVLELDEEEILYVLVHELAHLKAETTYHSSAFWEEVGKVFPENKARELEDSIMTKLHRRMV